MKASEIFLQELERDEGFASTPYFCTEGVLTVGIGTKLPLSRREKQTIGFVSFPLSHSQAKQLLEMRLGNSINKLGEKLPWLPSAPQEVQEVLWNMSYQLGVSGVLKFRKTLKLLQAGEYQRASREMLKSLWAVQTPNRAKRLSRKIAAIK